MMTESPASDRLVQRGVRRRRVAAPLSEAILRLELRPLRIQYLKKVRDSFAEPQARQLGGALARGARILEPLQPLPSAAIACDARLHVLHSRQHDAPVLRARALFPRLRRVDLRLHSAQVETGPREHRPDHVAQRPAVAERIDLRGGVAHAAPEAETREVARLAAPTN